MDRVKRTRLDAGTQTHAAVCTRLGAARNAHRCGAVLQAFVLGLVDGIAAAVAVNVRNLALARLYGYAHDRGDLLRRSCAADRTAVDRRCAFNDRSRHTVTARIAAAAAVGARQALAHQRHALIHFNRERLGRDAQQDREQDAHDEQDGNRRNDIIDIHFLSFPLAYQIDRPEKPMKDIASSAAETSAIGKPSKHLGHFEVAARRSRIEENRTIASV